jgi:hypothetical protein
VLIISLSSSDFKIKTMDSELQRQLAEARLAEIEDNQARDWVREIEEGILERRMEAAAKKACE